MTEPTGYVELTVNPGRQTTAYTDVDTAERPLLKLLCSGRFELTIKPEGPGVEDHDVTAAEQMVDAAGQYLDMVRKTHRELAASAGRHAVRTRS